MELSITDNIKRNKLVQKSALMLFGRGKHFKKLGASSSSAFISC